MILARVKGNAVSSVKHPAYNGHKVMVVQPLNADGEPEGKTFLAIDAVQSGPGDKVLVSREGGTVRQILGAGEAPLHAIVLSIVDHVDPQS
jgi:microcompartment protein CcmK/EutM